MNADSGIQVSSSPDVYFLFFFKRICGAWLREGSPYCGDLGGVWWGSLLRVFPGCGGGEAHRPAGLRASLGGLPGVMAAELALEEGGYVSLAFASPAAVEVSGHFRSSPAGPEQAGLASLGLGGGCCNVGVSFTRWQISA